MLSREREHRRLYRTRNRTVVLYISPPRSPQTRVFYYSQRYCVVCKRYAHTRVPYEVRGLSLKYVRVYSARDGLAQLGFLVDHLDRGAGFRRCAGRCDACILKMGAHAAIFF